MINTKPEDLTTEVVLEDNQVAIQIRTSDLKRTLSLDLSAYLVSELAQRLAEANDLSARLAAEKSEDPDVPRPRDGKKPLHLRRIGETYSILKWRREHAGSYVARGANGVDLRVFREGKGEWFYQMGDQVINKNRPFEMKVEAVEAVEERLMSTDAL